MAKMRKYSFWNDKGDEKEVEKMSFKTAVKSIQEEFKNQFFKKEHCEHCLEYPHRIIAWMFYCNDIKKGGGTKFPQQNFTAEPKEGTLLIWPAFWTHTHIGIKAPKEHKYIVTGWCSFY